MNFIKTFYLMFPIVLISTLGACSSFSLHDPLYSTDMLSREDLLSGQAIFGKPVDNMALPEDHVIALNEKMQAYLTHYIPKNYVKSSKVRSLMDMMLGAGTLNMQYDMSKTHTAEEAFLKSEGNCLAFSYLFIAFAREAGLKVSFQEVAIPLEWGSASGDYYYYSRHVNVRVHMKKTNDLIVDIDHMDYKPHHKAWDISDQGAIALYYSNKGTDFLMKEDHENAFLYLAKALKLAPEDGVIWSNLGVLYRIIGQHKYAERAYFIALKTHSKKRSVFGNLSVLYKEVGEIEKSEYYEGLAKEHQMKNPYYRYYQALGAYELGDYAQSLSHLKAALKRQVDEKKFYELLGETYAKLGEEDRANRAWEKAKKLVY